MKRSRNRAVNKPERSLSALRKRNKRDRSSDLAVGMFAMAFVAGLLFEKSSAALTKAAERSWDF
jgi:hypothetical protein